MYSKIQTTTLACKIAKADLGGWEGGTVYRVH